MKSKKLTLSIMTILGVWFLGAGSANATNWYVRDGGGSVYGTSAGTNVCNGQTNAVYSASVSPNCALNHPNRVIGYSYDSPTTQYLKSGDTLYIDGDSDINPGQQAQYMIGYDATGGTTPACSSSATQDCELLEIPAGISATQPTSIIGTGSHKPQLWGTGRIYNTIREDSGQNYVTFQWLEVTDHTACAYNDPTGGCNYSSAPFGPEAEDGMTISGTGITLTDVYVHGFGTYGIITGQMGSATFTRVWVIGNGYGGFIVGNSGTTSVTGTLTFNQPIIEWNGCVEKYPLTNTGIDNPLNYIDCFGQSTGGYGDGLAFGATGSSPAGNWVITGPGSISFNTQDGFDILHGTASTGTEQVDKMRFEGNAGQQLKLNGLDVYVTNSVIIGDCGWWYGAAQSLSGGMQPGDSCRAGGSVFRFNVTNGSISTFYNNTITSNSVTFESIDGAALGCNSSTQLNIYNNIIDGGYYWGDSQGIIGSGGGNSQSVYYYNDGTDGNGAGTCGSVVPNENYNIVTGTENNNQGCVGSHDKCGVNPGFAAGTFPLGTAGGAANTFYQGQVGTTLVSLSPSSPAVAAGMSGLTYWNNGNDYHNVTRTNPPSIGGLEANSCSASGGGCFYGSDCCGSASCSNFTCGTSTPQPVVSITSPSSGSTFTTGTNVTISATASEANGTITNIAIYNGSTLLGQSSSSPYSYVLTNAAAATYTLKAVATDANGVSTTSSSVTVIVQDASILPSTPVVNITSPVSGSSYTAGSNVTVTTTASETNGTISNISLYNGSGILLGSSSVSPFSYVDADLLTGTYTFYAVATDVNGVSTTSSLITVTVTAPAVPVVAITSPSNGNSVTGSTVTITASASETNGTIADVYFYNGSTLLGSSSTSPYSYSWTNVSAGSYTLTAVATDANGVSITSSAVSITVTASTPTAVAITSPANTSSFTAGSNITITASASLSSGTINKVTFYNGSTLLGTATKSPYSYTWSNVSAGSYSLTAKVYSSSRKVAATSTAVAITVTGLPVVSLAANNTLFTAPATINLTATASETNGTIAQVQFYNGATLLGTSSVSPYTYSWANVPVGSYTLTAVATDANGASTTSSAITATVSSQIETITVSAGAGGTISPSGAVSVNYGESQTFTVTPNAGYTASLTVDGSAVTLTNNAYTLSNVTVAHTVAASFTLLTETINASAGVGGTISPSGAVSVNYGASQTFTVTPNAGYAAQLTVDGSAVALTNNAYTLSNVTTTHTLVVSFALQTEVVNVSAGTGGTISPSGAVVVNYGISPTFYLTPNAGYTASLTVDGVPVTLINNAYTLWNVTATHTVAASFTLQTETINASAGSNGTISPSGAVSVNYGASQTFTVTPNAGYAASLTVDGSAVALTNNAYTLSNVTATHTVAASFALQAETVNASAGSNGTISPSGSVSVNYGTSQTFTVTPNAGYIASLVVDGSAVALTNNAYTLSNVTATHTVAASFTLQTETINASAGNGGTISPSRAVSVNYGASQTFTVTPNAGYAAQLTVDGSAVALTNNAYTLSNVTATHTVAASFTLQTETINASAGINGTINPSGAVSVNYGASQTFTVTPNAGYTASLMVDGAEVTLINNAYTLSNVTTKHTVTASFSLQSQTLTVSAGSNGSINPSGALVVNNGISPTFYLTPNAGYTATLTMDGVPVILINNAFTLWNVTASHTLVASFILQNDPIITASAGIGGTISPSGSVHVNSGANQTFTVTPDAGYTPILTVDGAPVTLINNTYTLTNITTTHTLTASFVAQTQQMLTVSAGAGGTISPSGVLVVNYGISPTFYLTPNAGYTATLTVDGVPVILINNAFTLWNVTASHTLIASFILQNDPIITATAGIGGTISPSGSVHVNSGASQMFTVTPNAGYAPILTVDGVPVILTNNTYTLNNVTTTHTVVASFAAETQQTLTVSAGAGGTISPSGVLIVNYGISPTFYLTPDPGYTASLTIDGVPVTLTNNAYSLMDVTASHTLVASFTLQTS